MATDLNTRRYAKNWFDAHGPQTRRGLIDGFRMTFAADLAETAVDDLFREGWIAADDDGMIRWVPEERAVGMPAAMAAAYGESPAFEGDIYAEAARRAD